MHDVIDDSLTQSGNNAFKFIEDQSEMTSQMEDSKISNYFGDDIGKIEIKEPQNTHNQLQSMELLGSINNPSLQSPLQSSQNTADFTKDIG